MTGWGTDKPTSSPSFTLDWYESLSGPGNHRRRDRQRARRGRGSWCSLPSVVQAGQGAEVRPSASSRSGVPQIGLPNDRPTGNPRSVAFCFDRSLSSHFQFHPACSSATAILQIGVIPVQRWVWAFQHTEPAHKRYGPNWCDGPGFSPSPIGGTPAPDPPVTPSGSVPERPFGPAGRDMPVPQCPAAGPGTPPGHPPPHRLNTTATGMHLCSPHPQVRGPPGGQDRFVQSSAKAATRFRNRRFQIYCLSTVNWVTINVPVVTAVVFK